LIGHGNFFVVQVLADFPKNVVVSGFLEIGHHDLLGIGFGFAAGKAHLLGCPHAEQLVAAGAGLEPEFLVVREFLFEAVLALVESRGHDALTACDRSESRAHIFSAAALHIAVAASRQPAAAKRTRNCQVENVR